MTEEVLQPRPLGGAEAEPSKKSTKKNTPSGLWWLLVLVVGGLLVIRIVSQRTSPPKITLATPTALPVPSPTPDPALRAKAEAELEKSLALKGPLRATEPRRWAPETWRKSEESMSSGDQFMAEKNFEGAAKAYVAARPMLEELTLRLPSLPAELFPKALEAYARGNATDSVALLQIILFLDPENKEAKALLPRAEKADQSFAILQAIKQQVKNENWDLAWAEVNRLDQIDSLFPGAAELKEQISILLSQQEFTKWISQALHAVEAQDLESAQQLLGKAKRLLPDHPAVKDLGKQVDELVTQQQVLVLKDKAEKLEIQETWAEAHTVWLEMKALDSAAPWIQEGLEQSLRWKLEEEKISRASKNLQSAQAALWVKELKVRKKWPPKLDAKALKVVEQWTLATTPVSVLLISDYETQIQVAKIGRWKPFREKEVILKPGSYVAKGIRMGYRDVRESFVVKPGQQNLKIEVICRERI